MIGAYFYRGGRVAALVAACLAVSGATAPGDGARRPMPPPEPTIAATADGRAVEAAFDRAFGDGGTFRRTGAVVAMVRDGRVLFVKGYGHEDAAGRVAVDPVETRFRLGSITKTLVGVGIGELVAAGRIASLDTPANAYLTRLKIPDNAGRPVTLRMLGTHQAGLAEARQPFQRLGDPTPRTDGKYVRANFPGYVQPVGTGANYSNYGAALLGFVIEDQTRRSFPQFAQQDIFAPLGMTRSTIVGDPRPRPRLADAEAFYPDGGRRQIPNLWSNHPLNLAAGGMASTGADMARYMIGLLGGGGDVPALLSPAARTTVFARQGGTHPLTQGYGVLFMLNEWNGQPLVEHGGRTLGTSSYMSLLPDRRTGIFVAVTGDFGQSLPLPGVLGVPAAPHADPSQAGRTLAGMAQLRAIGLEALLGRYRLPIRPSAGATLDPAEFTGQYVAQRRPVRSVTQIFGDLFLGGPLTVSRGRPGEILLGRTPYRQVARDVFWHDPALTPDRPSGWNDLLVFRRDAAGRVRDLSLLYTDVVYTRATGGLTPSRVNWLLAGGALVILSGLLSFAWASGSRGRLIAPLAALGVLLAPVVYFRSWPKAAVESLAFVWITPGDLAVFQIWLDATAALAAALIVFAALGFRGAKAQGARAAIARWHLRLLAGGAASLILAFAWYGMIGWNVR